MNEGITVEVVWQDGLEVRSVAVALPARTCVRDAIAAAYGECGPGILAGIWRQKTDMQGTLKHGDRVEIYPPLRADPKAARRLRARKNPA